MVTARDMAVLLFGAVCSAAPAQIDRLAFAASPLPAEWVVAGDADRNTPFRTVRLSLAPANPDAHKEIAAIALDRSNPDSARYGQYLTAAQLNAIRAPSPDAVDAVVQWAESTGCKATPLRMGATIEVACSVGSLSGLFTTSVSIITHMDTGRTSLRAASYRLPADIASVVTATFGLHGVPITAGQAIKAPPGEPADVTPASLAKYYGVTYNASSPKNKQAVAEFQGQTMSDKDLTKFWSKYMPDRPASEGVLSKVVGTNPSGPSGVEAALDVEYIMGIAPGVDTEFWGFQGQDFCLDLKKFGDMILSTDDSPVVFSISYGWQGPLKQIGCEPTNSMDFDTDLAAIAAKGISILISSGDSGSAATSGGGPEPPGPPPACDNVQQDTALTGSSIKLGGLAGSSVDACCAKALKRGYAGWTYTKTKFMGECLGFESVDGTKSSKKSTSGTTKPGPPGPPPPPPSGITLYPSWPASSPWVTAVGATRFINQDPTGAAGEMATDQFGSGGGFSTLWAQSPNATWQTAAVQAYLKADAGDLPPAGSFPPNGRGTPDVSALGEGFQVIADGQTQSVGGTSASSPTFAGMISVINGARMAAGKPALGFLNPWLYKNTAMFKDVTVGSNKVSRAGSKLKYGWACLPGWDAATGIGTPLFGKMLESAMQN